MLQADDESMAKYPVPPTLRPSVGLHEPLMLRFLLDTCATAEETKRALLLKKQPRKVVPAHYIVGDLFGNSFVWESSPLYNRDYITDEGGDIQIFTNHLLYPGSRPTPDPSDDPGWTFRRYRLLSEAIPTGNGGVSVEDLKTAHACVNFCAAFDRKMSGEAPIESGEAITPPEDSSGARDLGRTVWHSVYDLDERRLEVKFYLGESADGQSRYSEYHQFQLEQ